MTNRQFYRAVGRTKNKFRWTYTKPFIGIRAVLRNDALKENIFCPLEAVDFVTNDISWPVFLDSAKRLEIDNRFTDDIVSASDMRNKLLNYKQRRVRKAILNALGFKGRFA